MDAGIIWTGLFVMANTFLAWGLSRRGRRKAVEASATATGKIHAQLIPNGGFSLRDHIDQRFDHIETRLDSQDRRLIRVEAKAGEGA